LIAIAAGNCRALKELYLGYQGRLAPVPTDTRRRYQALQARAGSPRF